jgi:hypothetical protein
METERKERKKINDEEIKHAEECAQPPDHALTSCSS